MKKTIQLLMLLAAIPFLTQALYGQCIIDSDEDAADYCSDPCNTNEGLTIRNVFDLDCFVDLQSVGGDLIIDGTYLGSLGDLCELNSVEGNLIIDGNYEMGLVGFCDLFSIGGDLIIRDNQGSDELLDFSTIEYIGGDLIVTGNDQLEICCDLHCLVAATQGSVLIEDNGPICSVLEEIEGCEECPRVCVEDFVLDSQMAIDSFLTNSGCMTIQGDVLITGNDIVDLTGIAQLEAIEGTLTIDNCGNLINLETLTDVDIDNLIVSNNSSLESLNSQSLNIYGDVMISNNNNLANLDLLSWVIEGDLTIEENGLLDTCCDLLCGYISGSIVMENNAMGCNSLTEVDITCPDPNCIEGAAVAWNTLVEEGEPGGVIKAEDMVVLEDGYVIAGLFSDIGGIEDYGIAKVNLEGELVWEKNYGGTSDEKAYAITATEEGDFIVVGYTTSSDGDINEFYMGKDFWVIKLDESGNLLWEKTYGGDGSDQARTVAMTNDGFIVAGYSSSTNGDLNENKGGSDAWVIKIDGDGNLLWEKNFGGSNAEFFNDVKVTDNGNLICVGGTESNDGNLSINKGEVDSWILKLDESGNILWSKTYGGSKNDNVQSVLVDNGYIIVGASQSNDGDVAENSSVNYDAWCLKLDEEGNLLWENTYGGYKNDRINDIDFALNDGYIFVAEGSSQGGDVGVHDYTNAIWIVKINEAGELVWRKSVLGKSGKTISQINDGYVIAGTYASSLTSLTRYWVIELSEITLSNIHLCLEGAYDPATGRMKTDLADQNILPLTQPYNVAPYNYDGTEAADSTIGFPDNTVDWILLEARSGTPNLNGELGTEVIETIAVLLLADGSVVRPDGSEAYFRNLEDGTTYHIAIRHRNHLDIISQEAIEADSRMTYYFTLAQDQAFGTNQQKVLEDGKVVMYTGDYNQDGIIQITDFDLWKESPAQNNVYGNTDGTIDGIIQVTDYDAWLPNKAKIGNIEIQY